VIERAITDSPTWQLDQLVAAFHADRARRIAEHPDAAPTGDVCRYCRKPWKAYAGTRTDGHAACYVSRGFMQQFVAFTDEHFAIPLTVIADRLGVGVGFVRAWWNITKGNPRP